MENFKTLESFLGCQNIHLALSLVFSWLWTVTDEQWGLKSDRCLHLEIRIKEEGQKEAGLRNDPTMPRIMANRPAKLKELCLQEYISKAKVRASYQNFLWALEQQFSFREMARVRFQRRRVMRGQWMDILLVWYNCCSLKKVADLSNGRRDNWEDLRLKQIKILNSATVRLCP